MTNDRKTASETEEVWSASTRRVEGMFNEWVRHLQEESGDVLEESWKPYEIAATLTLAEVTDRAANKD